jgi:hypothetical protein
MKILGPMIIHDGTPTARHSAAVVKALCPASVEMIDTSTPEGKRRVAEIDRGLQDGTVDLAMPPLWFRCDEEKQKGQKP